MEETIEKKFFRLALEWILRRRGHGSQTSLAISADISQSYLNDIKSGRKRGSIDKLHKIAKALDTTYADMLKFGKNIDAGKVDFLEAEDITTGPPILGKPSLGCEDCDHPVKYNDPRTEKIMQMLKQFDENGDTAAIDMIFGIAKNGAEKAEVKKEVQKLKAEMAKLKKA